jgi:hypothetical protein
VCDPPLAGNPEYDSDGASNSTVITIMDDGNVDHGENDERERGEYVPLLKEFSLSLCPSLFLPLPLSLSFSPSPSPSLRWEEQKPDSDLGS